jgi:predicted HicB family RNase H-like nuclease
VVEEIMSTLTIDIPAEVYKQLAEEAKKAGKSLETLTRELLEDALDS